MDKQHGYMFYVSTLLYTKAFGLQRVLTQALLVVFKCLPWFALCLLNSIVLSLLGLFTGCCFIFDGPKACCCRSSSDTPTWPP